MKDKIVIEQTVSSLMDIVDTLIGIIKVECLDMELLNECKEIMKNLKHDW